MTSKCKNCGCRKFSPEDEIEHPSGRKKSRRIASVEDTPEETVKAVRSSKTSGTQSPQGNVETVADESLVNAYETEGTFNLSDKIHQHPYEYDEELTYLNEKDVKEFIRRLKDEINIIQKINVESSYSSGVSEPLRKQIMELIVGSFMELEDKINKLSGEKLV